MHASDDSEWVAFAPSAWFSSLENEADEEAEGARVPVSVRLRFGRAAAQTVADQVGADLLHIKGDAVHPSLRPNVTTGSDVDVLVRPSHVARLDQALVAHGWRLYSTFVYGSPFGHAQTYLHDQWGYLDLHRHFPGIGADPEAAFERMWVSRTLIDVTGIACAVPDVTAQSVLLILNSARDPRARTIGVSRVWGEAADDRRKALRDLVAEFDAEVAFAAAVGDLERYRGRREYRLWKVASQGGTRLEEWWARMRAEPTVSGALRTIARAPLVNVDHLTHELGRQPTRTEILREFAARPVRAGGEMVEKLRRQRRPHS